MMTVFRRRIIDGIEISYIHREDGETLIHSIIDPERDGAIRITSNGIDLLDEDIDGPLADGLIVFGTHKWDRFTVDEVLQQYPEYKPFLDTLNKA